MRVHSQVDGGATACVALHRREVLRLRPAPAKTAEKPEGRAFAPFLRQGRQDDGFESAATAQGRERPSADVIHRREIPRLRFARTYVARKAKKRAKLRSEWQRDFVVQP